jgi:putative transposase
MIREDAAMPVSRFCDILGIPRRSYFRRLTRMRSGDGAAGRRRAAPCVQLCGPIVATYTARWPELGHRRIHALMAGDGHVTSPSTVLRAMRLQSLSGRGADGDASEQALVANQIPGADISAARGDRGAVAPQA